MDSEQTSETATNSEVRVEMTGEQDNSSQEDASSINSRDEIEREKVLNMKRMFEEKMLKSKVSQTTTMGTKYKSRPNSITVPDVFKVDNFSHLHVPTLQKSSSFPALSQPVQIIQIQDMSSVSSESCDSTETLEIEHQQEYDNTSETEREHQQEYDKYSTSERDYQQEYDNYSTSERDYQQEYDNYSTSERDYQQEYDNTSEKEHQQEYDNIPEREHQPEFNNKSEREFIHVRKTDDDFIQLRKRSDVEALKNKFESMIRDNSARKSSFINWKSNNMNLVVPRPLSKTFARSSPNLNLFSERKIWPESEIERHIPETKKRHHSKVRSISENDVEEKFEEIFNHVEEETKENSALPPPPQFRDLSPEPRDCERNTSPTRITIPQQIQSRQNNRSREFKHSPKSTASPALSRKKFSVLELSAMFSSEHGSDKTKVKGLLLKYFLYNTTISLNHH